MIIVNVTLLKLTQKYFVNMGREIISVLKYVEIKVAYILPSFLRRSVVKIVSSCACVRVESH